MKRKVVAGLVGVLMALSVPGVALAQSGTGFCFRVVDLAFVNILNPLRLALWGEAPTC